MDRARDASPARPRRLRTYPSRRGGGALTSPAARVAGVVLVLMAALACNKFGPGGLNRFIALDVRAPDSPEEDDTPLPHARGLRGAGASGGANLVRGTAHRTARLTGLER